MKITDIQAYVVDPSGHHSLARALTFVQVHTDEGITGTGECSNYPGGGSLVTGRTVQQLRDGLVGEDPGDINRLWHKVYRRFTYLGSRGLPTNAISAVDIALWDIQGQALNRPVYRLLGGRFRDTIRLYANGWFVGCQTPEEYAAAAKRTVESGHTALKLDPFLEMRPYHTAYVDGQISPAGEDLGVAIVAAIRAAVGPAVEILIDAHGHYNVPTAVRLCRRLEPLKIGWFEEPVPPESPQALRAVREQVNVPICVGERLFTRFDFVPIFEQRLADYVMPDVVWTGGISELLRIATMAEAYYVPISPHNALGPIQIVAGAHAMMTVPNFYRLEHSVGAIPHYQACLDQPIEFRDDYLRLPERPGLGFGLNLGFVKANLAG
ncbi:MAG: mandelate racemase/muconate lactonizing enzyme family protein [Chloroflexi bacterium]|nr:mandelate racemase/muconate lactonizing enzyme family protein [Chloroflexota bacterium]